MENNAGKVYTERVDDMLIITIDNPPVNAVSVEIRQSLIDAIQLLNDTPQLRAGVLIGAGKQFTAGGDMREFGQPPLSPSLPDVAAALDASAKPVVAAMRGIALGGGLQLAFACDARVAEDGCVFGLPEVDLGLIPGTGGTQRLPRLVGLARAIRMIGASERIKADEALKIGLVDEVVDGQVREAAIRSARGLAGLRRRTRDLPVPAEAAEAIEAAASDVKRAGKSRPAVLAAIDVVAAAARLPFDAGLANESAVFLQMSGTEEAAALHHLFFAERESLKLGLPAGVVARSLASVAVIGAGTMGVGIAIAVLDAGMKVILLDQDAATLERGMGRIRDHYERRAAAGKIKADAARRLIDNVQMTLDWAQLAPADLVIEAVFEDMEVKRAVFALIDRHAGAGAVLATNTSYLDVDEIGRATSRPQDVLGLHFFSPANVMKLLEIVRGARTSPEVLATAMRFARALKKQPVVTGNSFGFIGNRIYNAYRRHSEFMLEDGAWPEQVDAALQAFGFAMGPFAVADLSGLDIAWRMRRAQAATRHPDERYVAVLDHLCEEGRLGRKTERGYYTYADGKRSAETDATVREIIINASARRDIERREIGAAEIQRRALAAMANEAARLLGEGVAARASDIDVALVHGYGFPRWRGGPVFWARRQPRAALEQTMDELARIEGPRFARGDIGNLLA